MLELFLFLDLVQDTCALCNPKIQENTRSPIAKILKNYTTSSCRRFFQSVHHNKHFSYQIGIIPQIIDFYQGEKDKQTLKSTEPVLPEISIINLM